MAIVRGQDGKFYDIEDEVLEGKEVKPEELPEDSQSSGPGSGPPGGGSGIESFGGGGSGIIQIFVNVPEGGGRRQGGGSAPSGAQQQSEPADVQGHNYCGWRNWRNWRNCGWRNCGF